MTAQKDEIGGGITIFSEKEDDIVGGIDAPFMNDASEENYSEDIYYELEEIDNKQEENSQTKTEIKTHRYILRLIVSEEYLDNEKTSYPVYIDPSVTWSGTTNLPESYVLSKANTTNYFSSGVNTFSVGKGSQGVFRTYLRAKELKSKVKNKYIDSAVLTIYENGSTSVGGIGVNVYPAKASFKCGSVTWKNQPLGTGTKVCSFTSKGKNGTKHQLNLKQWAQNVAKGSGNGYENY